ncbi:meiosis-specific nuclear structural protein 1-like [Onthophagus taurus]|uniref:meiosis-specific nuclear structural protein 1-like n=1 Tax=Onthophagus taurus TaxID=166361 RepID=UPI000C2096D4|nr:uncharacterized protein LOC111426786 [Onthophagus taurus]
MSRNPCRPPTGVPRVSSRTSSRQQPGRVQSLCARPGPPVAQSSSQKSVKRSARPTSSSGKCVNPTCEEKTQVSRGKKPPKDEKKTAKEVVKRQELRKRAPPEYELPALSVNIPKKDVFEELEKLKAKTRRRHAPEGEDLRGIKEILKGMIDQEITVHEFVGAISEYTADNGTVLRTILANELSHFRSMARRVYDTMTQDISDVLINEHVQLTKASKERHAQYTDKMMRAIDDIYELTSNFSFEKFYNEKKYLDELFPLAPDAKIDEESEAMQMRQETYHRLMWLRSEGDRLSEENKRLINRLKELKFRQKEQMKKAGEIEMANENKRIELEKTQEALEEELEIVNTSIEKSMVEQERAIRETDEIKAMTPVVEKRPIAKQILKRDMRPPENWGSKTAAEIEESHATEVLIADASRVSMVTSHRGATPSTGAVPKRMAKTKKKYKFERPKVQQDADAFHYSPPKTPPECYPAAGGQMETTRVTTTTSKTQQPRVGRRGSAGPRDSWRGFC